MMRRSLVIMTLVMMLIGCDKQILSNDSKILSCEQWHTIGKKIVNELELPALMALSKAEINTEMGINTDHLESFLVLMPMMKVHATEILVFQTKEGMMETVKKEVDRYLNHYAQSWSSYLSDQHVLVQNRLEKTAGNTLIVVIAEDIPSIESILDAALSE